MGVTKRNITTTKGGLLSGPEQRQRLPGLHRGGRGGAEENRSCGSWMCPWRSPPDAERRAHLTDGLRRHVITLNGSGANLTTHAGAVRQGGGERRAARRVGHRPLPLGYGTDGTGGDGS